jgi:hypothetical protein
MDATPVPRRITPRSGHQVPVRTLRPEDALGLAEAFERLSETSRYRRFFTAKAHLSEQTLGLPHRRRPRRPRSADRTGARFGATAGVARFIRNPRKPDTHRDRQT